MSRVETVLTILVAVSAVGLYFVIPDNIGFSTQTTESWNLLYHLGGYGPYVSKLHGDIINDTSTPLGCRIDQVHMIARHTERYPTVTAGIHMLELYHRIDQTNITLNGSLAFANTWNFFTGDPANDFEQLTSTGPYAGSLTAFKLGVQFKTDYEDVLRATLANGKRFRLWASDSQRVINTAKYFASGMLGLDWHSRAELQIIPETAERGADTLTPGDTCTKYADNVDDFGWDYGSRMVDQFLGTYLDATRQRLLQENPEFPLSQDEVYIMQEMCAFEIMAHGQSPWCDVFTHGEWEGFEYARDLLHYYRSGPGNPYAATMGWLWLNATSNLLQAGPEVGPLYLSFVHDGDIIPMLAALQLFPQHSELPTTYIDHNRTWRMSDTVPMGGRIIFERLACLGEQTCWANELYPNHVYCAPPGDSHFVRIIVNDRVVPLPGCVDGPGSSCPLSQFRHVIQRTGSQAGNFGKMCRLSDDAPECITFLHQ